MKFSLHEKFWSKVTKLDKKKQYSVYRQLHIENKYLIIESKNNNKI